LTGSEISYSYQAIVDGASGVRYVLTGVSPASPQTVNAPLTVTGTYKTQYYLTVTSPYDTPSGGDWYDAGATAYAMLEDGLVYVNRLAYGFTGWNGDASGWLLTSNPITMNGPKTAVANWARSDVYGDVRSIGFWRHQFTVWYRANILKIKGAGTAQVSVTELNSYLSFIWTNSEYFKAKYPNGITLMDAYNLLAPLKAHTMQEAAEQQLLAVWLNLAGKAFFWNTELSQSTLYVYCRYSLWDDAGLQTIGEAIKWSETELLANRNFEAVTTVCDSINNNLGIIWGT
jgi:hypothetical protein